MSDFQQKTKEETLRLVKESSAFRGEIADWLKLELADPEVRTYVAEVVPVNMHWKIGPFRPRTKLTFSSSEPQRTRLRFKNSKRPPTECKIVELGDEAVILVVDAAAISGAVSVRVEASGAGTIIEANQIAAGLTHKAIFIWLFKVIDRADMVGWYNPGQLIQTGIRVAISTIFGQNADYRATEAMALSAADSASGQGGGIEDTHSIYDYSAGDELWMDYVADTGDGWDSTYAIAYHIGQPQLKVDGLDGPLPRGRVLILGGDEVYPTASRETYRQRLLDPFECALPQTKEPYPDVYAIPGNHDWYDSLVSFTRLFCQGRWFAGWKTRQSRSYFALKLPHHWWLIGTDVQLQSDIDFPQVKYFQRVAAQMEKEDRIILCTAEPHWISDKLYKEYDNQINENNLAFLEEEIFCRAISVYIAGDLHHYRRHATEKNLQKITAGGGGAFLHPTHGEDVRELRNHYLLQESSTFPPERVSRWLAFKNLFFLFRNPWFGLLTGLFYLLTCWTVMAPVGQYGIREWKSALNLAISTSIAKPGAVFWILLIWGGFLLFTDTYVKWYRWAAGTIHGFVHVLCVFLIGWFATWVGMSYYRLEFGKPGQLLLAAVIIAVLGWIVGSVVMGVYLLVSLNVFGRHANEAFSALAIPDWKSFLRLRIDAQGRLTIFPLGIKRVPRKWKPSRMPDASVLIPDDPKATAPHLIEKEITIA